MTDTNERPIIISIDLDQAEKLLNDLQRLYGSFHFRIDNRDGAATILARYKIDYQSEAWVKTNLDYLQEFAFGYITALQSFNNK